MGYVSGMKTRRVTGLSGREDRMRSRSRAHCSLVAAAARGGGVMTCIGQDVHEISYAETSCPPLNEPFIRR